MNRALLMILFATATLADDFCWKDSYGRGVGAPLSECPSGTEKDGALCYQSCKSGYYGVTAVCWAQCPAGQNDTGAQCQKDSYDRGVGRPLHTCDGNEDMDGALCYPRCSNDYKGIGPACWLPCPDGYHDDGLTCRKDADIYGKGCCCIFGRCCSGKCPKDYAEDPCTCRRNADIFAKKSYNRGAGSPLKCADNEDQQAGLCYTQPKPGYKGVGQLAWQECTGETIDFGTFCTKKTYTRDAGVPMICKPDEDQNAALCYQKCKNGFKGVGPVCWGGCPAGWTDCGAGCGRDANECADKIIDMVTDTSLAIINIAAMVVGAGEATKSVEDIAKMAKKSVKVAKRLSHYAVDISKAAQKKGNNITDDQAMQQAQTVLGKAMGVVGDGDVVSKLQSAMDLISKVDPTGAVAAAKSFTYRKCSQLN